MRLDLPNDYKEEYKFNRDTCTVNCIEAKEVNKGITLKLEVIDGVEKDGVSPVGQQIRHYIMTDFTTLSDRAMEFVPVNSCKAIKAFNLDPENFTVNDFVGATAVCRITTKQDKDGFEETSISQWRA